MSAKRTQRARRVRRRIEGLSERLRLTIASYGSFSATAAAMDRSEGALRKWIRGLSEPNASDLRSLCELTGARMEWLIFGKEPDATDRVGPPGEISNGSVE